METTDQRPSLTSLPKTQPTLRVLFSHNAGAPLALRPSFFLAFGTTPLGRSLSGIESRRPGIQLAEDRQVSRLHATVHRDEHELRIVDEESRNGVFVNGRPIAPGGRGCVIGDGDVLRLGDSFLLMRQEPLAGGDADIPELLGRSPPLRELRSVMKQVAATTAMVLLLGESGTGKEVVARAIHTLSRRRGPFVAINCSAIPESLAESQLFGHLRGAFTGATSQSGLFRAAEGGTLFLDEVGELSPTIQPKLLRALEEGAVLPVGATVPQPIDVRIVAATNRALDEEVNRSQFRGDLLARLAELRLHLPPLRERREDILLLLERALCRAGGEPPRLHPDLVERLLLYGWPYNVRELFKVASELQIRGSGNPLFELDLVAERLPLSPPTAVPPVPTPHIAGMALATSIDLPSNARVVPTERAPVPSKEELELLLTKHQGVVADIAKEVRRSRAQVYRWLTQRGLDADAFRR